MIACRTMNVRDIPSGLSLCRVAGWNQLSRDWELFLQLNPEGCCVAVNDHHQVVGTVTTLRYEDRFSWIGMVLVDPTMQRQGIGKELLQQALQILSKEKTVKLDATPAGREVYLKLDFKDEYPLTRMHLDKIVQLQLSASPAFPLHQKDIEEVLEFDREVFGADRKTVLTWLHEGAPELAFITKEQNKITGYCFGRYGHNFTQIGPVIATDTHHAIHVVTAALRNAGNGPVIMDVLRHTSEWVNAVRSLGFADLRALTRMYKGSNAHPGIPEKQFSILGPEFG
jgi:predicted N-acetyltransferase YhbS